MTPEERWEELKAYLQREITRISESHILGREMKEVLSDMHQTTLHEMSDLEEE